LPIKIDPHEAIGYNIASQGLYEPGVTETLWRLTDKGEFTIDVGANIGYTASILAVRAGPGGKVICFEPNPEVFQSLTANVDNWKKDIRCASFDIRMAGLGKSGGVAQLRVNDLYLANRGTAWISERSDERFTRGFQIQLQSLDEVVRAGEAVGLLKIDVQGYELKVLQGGERMLRAGLVRDIVFEEENPYPAPTHEYLRSLGYAVFGISESFNGVRLLPDAAPFTDPVSGPPPNFLATVDPNRAISKMKSPFWRSFGFCGASLSRAKFPL
jgi:FkbM family methyltransferase